MGALIGGIIAVVLGVWGLASWFSLFLKGLQAMVPFLLLVGGVIAIAAGVSDLKDRAEEKKEKEEAEKEDKKETPAPAPAEEKKEAGGASDKPGA